jgi:hypothetical protein
MLSLNIDGADRLEKFLNTIKPNINLGIRRDVVELRDAVGRLAEESEGDLQVDIEVRLKSEP